MGRIRILPDAVVNKIAAGEVVERPASVLKELMENALDAGAGRIDVWAEAGGRSLLRVTDDGCGMSPDDALLAFDRHATSKIGSADDLTGIATLGFRGEALPSIAAVSRTTLTTRRAGDLSGTAVVIAGGRVLSSGETGAPAGTTVEVRDLFFNVPARRAFLRAPATEAGRLQDTFMDCCLARNDVAFSLTVDGKRLFTLAPTDGKVRRSEDLLGGEYTARMVGFSSGTDGVLVEGLISRPGFDFAGWDHLRTLVNRRPVRSPLLLRAVGDAFAPYAAPGRKPAAILWITIPGESVDVNVHPTKREVRFRNGGAVAEAVSASIRGVLGGRGGAADHREASFGTSRGGAGVADWGKEGAAGARQGDLGWLPPSFAGQGGRLAGIGLSPVQDIFLFQQGYRLLGQWMATYLVVESGDALYLIDQHVAHERILFERYRREMSQHIVSQGLVAPMSIGLPPPSVALLEERAQLLSRLGIEAEPGGPASVLIRALPAGIHPGEAEAMVRDLLGLLTGDDLPDGGGDEGLLDAAAARIACAGAIKAGAPLTPEESLDLLGQLAGTENPYRCPHGRPIIVSLPRRSVDRAFGRE